MNISIRDKKIYVYIIGIVMGTILYNCINMDFSIYAYKIIEVDFFTYFMYEIIKGIKFMIIIHLICMFDRKNIFFYIVSLLISLLLGGCITLFVKYGNSYIITSAIDYLFKILICFFIYERGKFFKSIFIPLIFSIVSALIQNFFIKIF